MMSKSTFDFLISESTIQGKPMAALKKKKTRTRYVVVKNPSYGEKLRGARIYYEGRKPKQLQKDGRITFGKHILEFLKRRLPKSQWIITPETDSIEIKRGTHRVKTSLHFLARLNSSLFEKTRDIKNDLVRRRLATVFPDTFCGEDTVVYVPGTLAATLRPEALPRLSSEDRDVLKNLLPDFIASESIGTVNLLKAEAQIRSLKELATDLERAIENNHGESWWQTYIHKNILLIQQGYIQPVDKMNIAIGNTKFPDFSLVTHDSYLDILEIKKPSTPLIKLDDSRGNFYWETELSKAIIQVENYIMNVAKHADAVRSYLLDEYKIKLQVLRPRGIILAGDARTFTRQKESDDFRLLSQSLKNVTVVTYDELLIRLRNYTQVLEEFRKQGKRPLKKPRSAT